MKPKTFLKLDDNLSSETSNWISENFPSIYRQIREQIAEEIESFMTDYGHYEHDGQIHCIVCQPYFKAGRIARGKK